MKHDDALAVLEAAQIPTEDASAQLFRIERVLSKLGTSIEQHADLLAATSTLADRVEYLAAVFGQDSSRAAHALINALRHQKRPTPPGVAVGNTLLTAPLPPSAQWALDSFDARHSYERDEILASWGLSSLRLAPVKYQVIVSPDDVREAIGESGDSRGKEQS